MIVSLRGVYRGHTADGIVVEVGGVGYEVMLPPIVEQALGELADGAPLDLRIAYHATRDQPVPVLYGFTRDEERRFWELLKSAPKVGPKSAARAMVLPIHSIAQAIQEGNRQLVDSLPGISAEGAEKIIASLRKRVAPFAALEAPTPSPAPASEDELERLAVALLVEMGIKRPDAQRDIARLRKEHPDLRTVEDLVMEYFRKSPK
ncbi:MAG TPA: Holliday junction branch migration protein RuvA [Chloroflexota bacterium]|nr:Holliday junction branch migration protein RuvA [Chloroflexota bacterium]